MPCTHRHTLATLFSAQRWLADQVRGCRLTPAPPTPSLLLLLRPGPPFYSPHHPWGEYSVEWMAPDRGLRGWNVSLALQGSDPPEHWRTAQSLLINHCQGCPGPGPNNHEVQPPFFCSLSHTHPKNSYIRFFHIH